MDVNHWKKYFLFPFAQIAPFPDILEHVQTESINQEENEPGSDGSFNKLVSKKYLFPLEMLAKH
jgi:hypothetical protein